MSTDGVQVTFSELLQRHGKITIPLIQRDYAQGRDDQDEVRDDFLSALHAALTIPSGADASPLNLDFVYGSVSTHKEYGFQPLDGQQRLTTLFLLHWYLSWHDERQDHFRDLCADGSSSRFGYHVRPSSSEFFDALATFSPDGRPTSARSVSGIITNQPWYFRSWRLDPTIQSALVMLDAIHGRFFDHPGLYDRLVNNDSPAITFQLLDLHNFQLSDDLYIKMNARGKPLTPFETFKARYEQILSDLYSGETRRVDGAELTVSEFFSRRMDTRWSDFFWPHRDPETHLFDDALMNLFRAIILATRHSDSESFVDDVTKLRSRMKQNSYSFFTHNDWLDKPFTDRMIALLEAWSDDTAEFSRKLSDTLHFDEVGIFRRICKDPTTLGYDEIVKFLAYGQFLQDNQSQVSNDASHDWMRVVSNLAINTEYNRPADMQRSFAAIAALSPFMDDILSHLASEDCDVFGFSREQIAEERLKARLIKANSSWRNLIDRAERHPYFAGQISFLLASCGVTTRASASSGENISPQEHTDFQSRFSYYLDRAEAMFTESGLAHAPDFLWERALLSFGNYLLPSRRNHSFLVDNRSDQASWKRLLRQAGTGGEPGRTLATLWDNIDPFGDIHSQLRDIISSASAGEPWRNKLIHNPRAIRYCSRRMIRIESNKIYLLTKAQMNGTHTELFTYCLYLRLCAQIESGTKLKAMKLGHLETATSDEEPGILLSSLHEKVPVSFSVKYEEENFKVLCKSADLPTDSIKDSLLGLDFKEGLLGYSRKCSDSDIEALIFSLDELLVRQTGGADHP